jgi:amino acid adenylation domain-containing protein
MSVPSIAPGLTSEVSPETFPLTGMQAGMLVQTLTNPHGGVDVVQVLCHLAESVDPEDLAARWQRAVERYDALRLGFDWTSGSAPTQRIHDPFPITLECVAAEDWGAEERQTRLESWLTADRQRPFALESPPLFRLAVFRFAPRDHLLVFTFHHIALDGRSLLPVLSEVLAGEAEQPAARDEPPQYGEYLEWLKEQKLTESGPFWQSYLGDIDFPLVWGFDRGSIPGTTPNPDLFPTVVHSLPWELTAALRERADELGVTVNTFLQGAWGLLLGRASGVRKVCFGTIRACRHDTVPRALETVGFFTNTLPVAVSLDDDQPVHAWLQALREDHLVLRAWEQTPLGLVRQSLRLPPQVPLYETLLAFETHDLQAQLHALGPQWRTRRFEFRQHTGLPLTVAIVGRYTMALRIKYDSRRVADSLAQRLATQFQTVLWGLVEATAATRLGEVAILPPAEIERQVREFNATFRDDSDDVCLPQMFLEQAQRTPDRVAVVEGDRSLTYRELVIHAERLAQRLAAEGLGPGRGVGLWSDRSLAGTVAVLGMLLAGVHYVPLPSDAPAERIALLVRDAGIDLVLTATLPAWRDSIPDVRCLSIEEAQRGAVRDASTLPTVGLDALFCVIYTSGTTGLPKGARLTHRGFTNLLRHRTETRFEPGDFACSPLTAPWHFDGSIVQLFSPLITGGTLVVCGPVTELGRSPWYHHLTALTGASSLIAGLVREFGPPRTARVVGLGAEPLPADLLELLLKSPAFERLLTGYGVTESSCYSTDLVLFDRRTQASSEPPRVTSQTVAAIGRPIANTQAYILDSRQRLLPLGVVGELCLGGVGVAQGYLQRPELTSQKFVPDPFQTDSSRRLYRTGDVARWNEDGTLEFLGRRDHQVKFRGYRIELGEIEAKLAEHPDVRQAVVLVREDLSGGPQLVGYLLPRDESQPLQPASLRQFLAKLLPAYMIPTQYVVLETLPLTPNGKIDRRALPRPETRIPSDSSGNDLPLTGTQARLKALFANLFQREEIGLDQGFFELGGHSLLAVRLFLRIQEQWGIRLPIETLLEAPTIAALASRIDTHRDAPGTEGIVLIKPGTDPQPLFLMPSATGNTLFWGRLVASAPEHLMLLGVDPPRSDAGEPWMMDLEQTLAGMLATIEKRQPEGPVALLGYSAGVHLAQELARRLENQGRTLSFVGLIDTGPLTETPWLSSYPNRLTAWVINLRNWLIDNNHRRSWKNLWSRLTARRTRHREIEAQSSPPSGYRARQQRFGKLLVGHRPAANRTRLTLFRARCQSPWKVRPECLGWTGLGCTVRTVIFPGVDHFDIMRAPHMDHLARVIFATLEEARRATGSLSPAIESVRPDSTATPSRG